MKHSRLPLFIAILTMLVALAVAAWQWSANTGQRVIAVGLYENAPKVYTDANGHPSGLFVEFAE